MIISLLIEERENNQSHVSWARFSFYIKNLESEIKVLAIYDGWLTIPIYGV